MTALADRVIAQLEAERDARITRAARHDDWRNRQSLAAASAVNARLCYLRDKLAEMRKVTGVPEGGSR